MPVYGVPGGGLEDRFGTPGRAGAVGERALAAKLKAEGWYDKPDTHLFFGVRVDRGDADCVVVRGRLVVILDVKKATAGTYRNIFGTTFCGGQLAKQAFSSAGLANGIRHLDRRLPAGTDIRGRMVLVSAGEIKLGFGMRNGARKVPLADVDRELHRILPKQGTRAARQQPGIIRVLRELTPSTEFHA